MDIVPVEIRYYRAAGGHVPFLRWFDSLDPSVQAVIDTRLNRLSRGLFGDAKPVGNGVFELRIDEGPGYRLYIGRFRRRLVIVLQGGDKSSQSADILAAKRNWSDYLRRKG